MTEERAWPETNCYVDLWLGLLPTLELDPIAMLACALSTDFEGDQWTFFKPSLADLYTLYGIDVQELTIWRSLLDHTAAQTARGRAVLLETDSFFLPDTAGVSYQIAHTKTTIAVRTLDPATRTMEYFHNAGYFTLTGDDFDGVFRQGAHAATATMLAPYVEIAKFDRMRHRTSADLMSVVTPIAQSHLSRRPDTNPFIRYRDAFTRDVAWLSNEPIETFHLYAFATLRQCGACAEMAESFLRWVDQHGVDQHGNTSSMHLAQQHIAQHATGAADACAIIARNAKALQFKTARLVSLKKPTDVAPMFDAMERAWETATLHLNALYGQ